MARSARGFASDLAVALLVLAIAFVGLFEAVGDCGFEGRTDAASTLICMHGDGNAHERSHGPCTPDHHGPAQCGCTCHLSGIVPPAAVRSIGKMVQLLPAPAAARVPERREPPALRPPIAG